MKIKFLQGLAGPKYVYNPGDIADMGEKQAVRLCKAGIARPVKEAQTETATMPVGETAAVKDKASKKAKSKKSKTQKG